MTVKAMAKLYGLLSLFITQGTYGYDPEASITGLYTGPYFDPLAPRNFTAHLGDQANLPCTVRQLGDKSVSWVRMRDADILTVDRYTFVGDERFESHYSAPLETWNLVIKYVQERDAGLYECQVSTEPKMSQLFSLRVVIPKVAIMPPGDRYVKAGSQVRVDCQITDVVQLPDYIFWYHEDKRVMDHLDSNLMVTVKKAGVEAITSTLTVHKVPPEGSGNYTCMPSNLHAASVILHVLNEKHPAAMQGDFTGSARQTKAHPHLLLLLMVFVMLCRAPYLDFNEGNNEATSDEQQPLDRPSSFSGKVTLSSSSSSLSRLSSTCAFHLDHTSMKKILMALEDDIDATENVLGKDAICFQDFPERVPSSSSSSFSARKFQSRIGEPRVIYYWSRALIEPSSGVLEIQPLVSIREVIEGYREVTQHLMAISKWIPAKISIDRADRDHDEEEGESEDLVPQASFWSCHSDLRQRAPLVVNR